MRHPPPSRLALLLLTALTMSPPARAQSPDTGLLDALMATRVGPGLGRGSLCFVHRYPASQAALAQIDATDTRCALRFELYCEGIEVANIKAMGQVYGLERLQDFPGTYVRAPQITAGGLWLKNANGVTMHLVAKVGGILIVAGDAVVFKLNH